MENFKASVPTPLAKKIRELAEYIQDNLCYKMINCRVETCGESTLEHIQGNHKSGWVPLQDGGHSVNIFLCSGYGSGIFLTESQRLDFERQQENCIKDFIYSNDLKIEYCDFDHDKLSPELQEQFYDYEREWLDDTALLSFEIFCDGYNVTSAFYSQNQEETVTMRSSLNYRDAPYYRDRYAEDIKSHVLTVEQFMELSIEQLAEMLVIN